MPDVALAWRCAGIPLYYNEEKFRFEIRSGETVIAMISLEGASLPGALEVLIHEAYGRRDSDGL